MVQVWHVSYGTDRRVQTIVTIQYEAPFAETDTQYTWIYHALLDGLA